MKIPKTKEHFFCFFGGAIVFPTGVGGVPILPPSDLAGFGARFADYVRIY